MDAFLKLSPDDQRLYCEQAQSRLNLPPASIEKDFWVCWTLRELFNLPSWGEHLSFKGGTSLAKAWKLGNGAFAIKTVAARRTFWDKAMLLHEETYRPADKPRKRPLARHYYDLWCLIQKGVATQAVADTGLFDRVATHRQEFFDYNWMDYEKMRPGSLRLLPLADQLSAWRGDYREMKKEMFFGKVPEFDEILRVVGEFEKQFNQQAKAKKCHSGHISTFDN